MRCRSILLSVLVAVGVTGSATAQAGDKAGVRRADHEYRDARDPHAPGARCRGMSYGTGAQSCGTATGGPVGGIGARN